MPRRVCSAPGCPTLVPQGARGGRCSSHERARDRARGTAAERGYGAAHRAESRRLKALVTSGRLVRCWRCEARITDPANLHLGHDDHDRSITRGAECASCNLGAAGRAGHRA